MKKEYQLNLSKPELTAIYHALEDSNTRMNRYARAGNTAYWIQRIRKNDDALKKVLYIKDYELQESLCKEQ